MKRIIQCFRHPATNRSRPPKQEDDNEEEEHDQKPYILQLPDHIIMEIFCKIPTKTLIQCKRVCKSWRCCLLDPQFTRELFSRTPACLVVTAVCWPWDHFVFDLDRTWNSNIVALKLSSEISPPITVLGSCNGFLCFQGLHSGLHLHISNPVTGEHLPLPTPTNYGIFRESYGFGFSPISGVYKLVRITNSGEVMVLTVGSEDWRNIGIPAYSSSRIRIPPGLGIYLNGFLHWIGRRTSDSSRLVCVFDVESEKFHELPLPPYNILGIPSVKLRVLKGWLSVTLRVTDDISVWVMKDYGVEESWAKENEFKEVVGLFCTSILKFTEEGKVLGINYEDHSMQPYTLARMGLRRVEVDGLTSVMVSAAWDLVPVKSICPTLKSQGT